MGYWGVECQASPFVHLGRWLRMEFSAAEIGSLGAGDLPSNRDEV
jgi:hypothetical protein